MSELDKIVRETLTKFTDYVFRAREDGRRWGGLEREAVSLYAFGYLVKRCLKGSVLYDPAQIGIEVRVPRLPMERVTGVKSTRICKDLVLWPKPSMTWLDGPPLAVLEWKTNRDAMYEEDIRWLTAYSGWEKCQQFTGSRGLLGFDGAQLPALGHTGGQRTRR